MAGERAVINQLNLVARDYEASCAFYRLVGLDVPDTPPYGDDLRHAEVAMAGGFSLELDSEAGARMWHAGWRADAPSSRVVVGVALESRQAVDDRYAELTAAGYQGRQPPYDAFWGARYAVVADPDGNDVGLMSPADDDHRQSPPVPSPDLPV